MNNKIVPVILNGGSGTRLWPMSHQGRPKQFLSLFGDDTLFQTTVKRAMRITGAQPSDVVTVTLTDFKEETMRQALEINSDLTDHILFEPEARNTAAAIIYAAYYVRQSFGKGALMWVLPSDHHITDENALKQALQNAISAAQDGNLVTFGIKPTHAETVYGYILKGSQLNNSQAYAVQNFVEKPPLNIAKEYFKSGKYLWNSGMNLFRACDVIDEYLLHARESAHKVETSMTPENNGAIKMPSADIYASIKKEPYDKAVLEKAKNVAVVPCNIGWSDVGSWRSLWEVSKKALKAPPIEVNKIPLRKRRG